MKQERNEFDVNLDPELTKRLQEIFNPNNESRFGDYTANKNKTSLRSKMKKIFCK